jgi:hypothetical protein
MTEVEEYLTTKGWEFVRVEDPTTESLGKLVFAYDRSEYSSEFAESYLYYLYSIDGNIKRVATQISNQNKYLEFLEKVKSYGCKLYKSKVENGSIVKVYRGKTTTFEFRISSGVDENLAGTATHHLAIFSNEDYDSNF